METEQPIKDEGFGEALDLNEEIEDPTPEKKPETPQARAEAAVNNAILENRKYTDSTGRTRKIHNISDNHIIVWNQMIADGRDNAFQVMSLLWCLLQPPKQIIKVGALSTAQMRLQVLNFMVAEKVKGDRLLALEEELANMLEETQAVQVTPVDDETEGKE